MNRKKRGDVFLFHRLSGKITDSFRLGPATPREEVFRLFSGQVLFVFLIDES